MSYIGAKKRLGNIPSSTRGAIPTILRAKKKQKNARQVPNINTVTILHLSIGSTVWALGEAAQWLFG